MRIEAYTQVQQLYSASKPTGKTSAQQAGSFKDRLNISSTGRDMQVAKEAVAAAPDVRMDKVNELKAALASGTYNVSGEEFADKLLAKYSQTLA